MNAANQPAAPDTTVGEENPELDELFTAAYSLLRQLARTQRRRRPEGLYETMSTTALVHEAYLKLSQQRNPPQWESRGHFFGVAARAMRHILTNYAERKRTLRRGGGSTQVPIEDIPLIDDSEIDNLLALDEALTRLERHHPRQARVVECRFFAGLNVKETAEALDISPTSVKRDWQWGQAKLFKLLNDGATNHH